MPITMFLAVAGVLAFTAVGFSAPSASAAPPINFASSGNGAGQVNDPVALTVDQSTGTVYVGEVNGRRIDEFDSDGNFERSFGWGVLSGAEELQVCTAATGCLQAPPPGLVGAPPGYIQPSALAVDPSSHDVYAFDRLHHRVEVFTPAGVFLLAFGKGVNTGTSGNPEVCTNAGPPTNVCGAGSSGTAPGQLATEATGLAFDPSGDLWVGDVNRLEQFGPEGAFLSEVKLPAAGTIVSLAVDSADNFYVRSGTLKAGEIENDVAGVRKYKPNGESTGVIFDESGHPNGLALDPTTGDLFVSDQPAPLEEHAGTASLFEYDPAASQTESFGTGGVIGGPTGNALAFGDSAQRLYVVSSQTGEESAAQIFALPAEGPLPEEGSEVATPVKKTAATLHANVNPEGHPTTVHFEYITEQKFKEDGNSFGAGTEKTLESGSIGEDFSQHPASVEATELSLETAYRFRLVATNEKGVVKGEGAAFTTEPPLRIDATYATEVSSTGATLGAQVNPFGDPASYHFEYLTAAEYEANLAEGSDGFSGPNTPTSTPVPDAAIASGEADITVSRHLSGLAPSTGYRYRVFLTNFLRPGGIPGPVRAFSTQGPGGPLVLPDNRAWEMVSPVEKSGGGVSGIDQGSYFTPVEAAADGEAITYGSPVAFADPAGSPPGNQYLSRRHGEAGWSTENIGLHANAENYGPLGDPPYKSFSFDLTSGLVSGGDGKRIIGQSTAFETPPLPGTEAAPGFGNFYLRDNGGPSYRAILTEAGAGTEASLPLQYEDATPDLSHLVFGEEGAKHNLYEWSEGTFQPLNLLPGKTTPTPTSEGLGNGEAQIGSGGLQDLRALSADGRRAVWAARTEGSKFYPPHNLYLRQNIGQPPSALAGTKCTEPELACTVQIDAPEGVEGKGGNGTFLAASADDSAIFFADHQRLTPDSTADQLEGEQPQRGDLYRFQPDAEAGHRLTDLTVDHADPAGAEVLGVLGGSDDGSYLYFAANGVLASNPGAHGDLASHGNCQANDAAPGAFCNLYLYHAGETTFVTTLAGEDEELGSDVTSLGAGEGQNTGSWRGVGYRDARVSPDGTHLLFVSYRGLTGYDNLAANGTHCGTGGVGNLPAACPEVFRYQAPTAEAPLGELACVSCNPTGQRPRGLSGVPTGTRTAPFELEGIYQSRALSANGRRAFFDSYDAIVPQDTNGHLDVYQWEEAGEGTCTESSSTFSSSSGGCVSLISSGTGSENSSFMDASADGSAAFFITGSSLVPQDPGSVDLYDARENGGLPEPPPPPASCQGDACQSPPPAPNDPTPASSSYNGPGNEHPVKPKKPKKHKAHKHKKKAHKQHKRANANRGGAK